MADLEILIAQFLSSILKYSAFTRWYFLFYLYEAWIDLNILYCIKHTNGLDTCSFNLRFLDTPTFYIMDRYRIFFEILFHKTETNIGFKLFYRVLFYFFSELRKIVFTGNRVFWSLNLGLRWCVIYIDV